MRAPSWLAALAAASPILLCGALPSAPALAQDTAAPEEIDDPNAGTVAPTASPNADATQPESPAVTPVQTVPIPAAATPIVAAIRAKIADPDYRKTATAGDIAALEAFYDGRSEPVWMTDMGFSNEAQAAIDEILDADDWGLSRAAFDLPPAGDLPDSVDKQAANEIELNLAILKYARYARGGRTDPDKLKNVDMQPTFRDPKLVLAEITEADQPDAYLQSLHPKHEQFQRLRQALLKARAESEAGAKPRDLQKILINMERWRWMPEDLGALYVQINIPEFMSYIVKNGNTIRSEKVVVGKQRYATPIFSADLKSIVFNPEWTVPPTIVREDLLPRLRGGGGGFFGSNTSVLKQHGLQVNYKGKRVNPSSINWSSVNMGAISFTQAPGPTNVLGKVKFLYPNRHSVYMHDTIKRNLLSLEVRAEGHHCPRVANPGEVAAVILAENRDMAKSEVDKLLKDGYNSGVEIRGRVPVHTTYFTASVDSEGKVQSFNDIYGLDAGVTAAVFGKQRQPEAVADNVKVETTETAPKPPEPSTVGAAPPPSAAGFSGAAP